MNCSASVTSFWEVRLADGSETKMSLVELDHAFEEGAIDTTTLVREVGNTEWLPLGRAAGLEGDRADDHDPPASAVEAGNAVRPPARRMRKAAAVAALIAGATLMGALFVATIRFVPQKLFPKHPPAARAALAVAPPAPPLEAVMIGPPVFAEPPPQPAPAKPATKKPTKGKVRSHAKHH